MQPYPTVGQQAYPPQPYPGQAPVQPYAVPTIAPQQPYAPQPGGSSIINLCLAPINCISAPVIVQPATVVVQAPRFGKQPVMAQCPYCQQQVCHHFCRYYFIHTCIFIGNDKMRTREWSRDMVSLRRLLLVWSLAWLLLDSILSQRHEGYSSHLHKLQENYSRSQNSFLDCFISDFQPEL